VTPTAVSYVLAIIEACIALQSLVTVADNQVRGLLSLKCGEASAHRAPPSFRVSI
jgi:hypothetical protein